MIQRLTDIRTDATAAFEKESKMLLVYWDYELVMLALADKASGEWNAAEVLKYSNEDSDTENFVNELKQKSTLVNYSGMQTQVYVATNEAMLIPAELAADTDLFLQTQFGNKAATNTFTATVNEAISVGFLLNEQEHNTIQKLFPQAEIKSSLGLLVQQALQMPATANGSLLLNIGKAFVELVIVQNGNLLLARNFTFIANEDVLYHLLNACRVLNIAPQEANIVLQGPVQKQDAVYLLLEQYFANLQFAQSTKAISHAAFSQVPAHYFTPLMQVL